MVVLATCIHQHLTRWRDTQQHRAVWLQRNLGNVAIFIFKNTKQIFENLGVSTRFWIELNYKIYACKTPWVVQVKHRKRQFSMFQRITKYWNSLIELVNSELLLILSPGSFLFFFHSNHFFSFTNSTFTFKTLIDKI